MIDSRLLLLIPMAVVLGLGLWRFTHFVMARRRLPYQSRTALNSPTEQAFYAAISRAVGTQVIIACKVRVADVLEVRFRKRHRRDRRWWYHFRQISAKHVDFVLCTPHGGRILLAIELDDRSHARSDRKRSDRFKDRAFASAGVPLVRFTARRQYDAETIHTKIAPHICLTTPKKDRLNDKL
nr:DUF2726 domain-containing protein [uncultured Halomonas sp.]